MSVRRTLFSHNGRTAYLYSHMKNIDISGHVGDDRSTWLAYTGSNNFTNSGHPLRRGDAAHPVAPGLREVRPALQVDQPAQVVGGLRQLHRADRRRTRTVGSRSAHARGRVSRITPPGAGRISQSAARLLWDVFGLVAHFRGAGRVPPGGIVLGVASCACSSVCSSRWACCSARRPSRRSRPPTRAAPPSRAPPVARPLALRGRHRRPVRDRDGRPVRPVRPVDDRSAVDGPAPSSPRPRRPRR